MAAGSGFGSAYVRLPLVTTDDAGTAKVHCCAGSATHTAALLSYACAARPQCQLCNKCCQWTPPFAPAYVHLLVLE
jgi:hypothetical protein